MAMVQLLTARVAPSWHSTTPHRGKDARAISRSCYRLERDGDVVTWIAPLRRVEVERLAVQSLRRSWMRLEVEYLVFGDGTKLPLWSLGSSADDFLGFTEIDRRRVTART